MLGPVIALAGLLLGQLAGAPADGQKVPAADAAAAKRVELEAMARRALAAVERMRHQKLPAPLKMGVKSRADVTAFIQERLKEEYGPAKVSAEGRMLSLQGLLPPEMDYGAFLTHLLTEQVAGFYDHTRQELHIADWLPTSIQEPVMAHEIFHAIQDQGWGAGKLIDSKKYTHDEVLAHAALLEGDATIVMLNYQGGVGDDDETDMAMSGITLKIVAAALPMQMASPDFPVMAAAPDYLKQSLIFPYQMGLLFVGALRQAGWSWDKVRTVYADPPASTEQILHPERYITRDVPSVVTLDGVLPGYTRGWEGTLGEFHLRQLLLSGLDQLVAEAHAAGWDGDFTALAQKGDQAVTITVSQWDSAADAADFDKSFSELQAKRTDGARCQTRLDGPRLDFACATDPALAATALKEAQSKAKITVR